MSAKPSFSLGRALSAAAAALPVAWGGAWLAMILVWAAGTFGLRFAMSVHMDLSPSGGSFTYASADSLRLIVFVIVMLILGLTAKGAVYRAILFGKDARKEGLGLGGLQFGWPELRLLASDLIAGLFTLIVVAAVLIVFAVAFATVGAGHGYPDTMTAVHAMFRRHQGSDWVFVVYAIGAVLLLLFLAVRFTLRHAATIGERRIVAINALSLSSGNVGKLFAGLIVILIPILVLCGGLVHLFAHGAVHGFQPLHHHLALQAMWLHATVHAVLIGLAGPLLAGFLSSAYRQIVDFRAK